MEINFVKTLLLIFLIFGNLYSQKNISTSKDSSISKTNNGKIGTSMPVFSAMGIDNKKFSSSKTKKIVFYNFWFSACKPCKSEIPLLNEIQQEFKGKVDFISISFDDIALIKKTIIGNPFYFKHHKMERELINSLNLVNGYPTNIIVVDNIIVYLESGGPSSKDSSFIKKTEALRKKYKEMLNKYLE